MIAGMKLERRSTVPRTRTRAFKLAIAALSCAASFGLSWNGGLAAPALESGPRGAGSVMCTTRASARQSAYCSPIGPVAQTNGGDVPLPTQSSDPNLGFIANDYLYVSDGPVDIYEDYTSGRGAINRRSTIQDGFVYLSAYDQIETEHGIVYRTPTGYVSGGSVSRIELSYLRGLSFYRTPESSFGWITSGGSCPQRTPGGAEDYAGSCYTKYTVFKVYDRQLVDDTTWYEIAPGEWLDQRLVSIVDPNTARPEGIPAERWISINLFEQTLAVYEGGELIFATVASTGHYGAWTQPGNFQVWAKLERDDMTGGLENSFYFLQNVPWVLYFDNARALHGTYWHDRFGTPTSRGCVNLSPADAEWIYRFADEGTWVHVWDPSGETPTDPELYGAGGA